MKKKSLMKRLRYWFDCIMSRGTAAMIALLFSVLVVIVGVISVAAYFFGEGDSFGYQLWNSLMHAMDTGNLAGNSVENLPYLLTMCVATFCGLFVTSILIGIITTGVESKLQDLRKGTSVVQEEKHTVIIGFDNNIFTLLRELIKANANQKRGCIVVLGEQPKEEMEEAIAARIPNTGNTRIICRSGGLHEAYALERCAVEACKSVIVNIHEDAQSVKTVLALAAYLKGKKLTNPDLRFVVSMQDSQYIEPAVIAGEGRAEVIYAKDAIARIIAHTCHQHGLSQVFTELFNFSGNELYFENVPAMVGKTMHEAAMSFSNAVLVGLCRDGLPQLNVSGDTVIGNNDQLILLEEDDGVFKAHQKKAPDAGAISGITPTSETENHHLLVLGSNDKLPIILSEYNHYVPAGTQVVIVDEEVGDIQLSAYENLNVTIYPRPITRKFLLEFPGTYAKNILLLNDDSRAPEESDSQTLLRLILLRDVADKTGRRFAITTEMQSVDNQRLASRARVDDFVIGSNFASLLMAQISENHLIAPLIRTLLDESGCELYMRPAANYVRIGEPVDAYTMTEAAARHREVYIGYRRVNTGNANVIVNPNKDELIAFGPEDQIVVIAEN